MASPGAKSKTLRDLLDGDIDEEADYERDNEFVVPMGSRSPPLLMKTTLMDYQICSQNEMLRTR